MARCADLNFSAPAVRHKKTVYVRAFLDGSKGNRAWTIPHGSAVGNGAVRRIVFYALLFGRAESAAAQKQVRQTKSPLAPPDKFRLRINMSRQGLLIQGDFPDSSTPRINPSGAAGRKQFRDFSFLFFAGK